MGHLTSIPLVVPGFTTKVLLGSPTYDSTCCVPVVNGLPLVEVTRHFHNLVTFVAKCWYSIPMFAHKQSNFSDRMCITRRKNYIFKQVVVLF